MQQVREEIEAREIRTGARRDKRGWKPERMGSAWFERAV